MIFICNAIFISLVSQCEGILGCSSSVDYCLFVLYALHFSVIACMCQVSNHSSFMLHALARPMSVSGGVAGWVMRQFRAGVDPRRLLETVLLPGTTLVCEMCACVRACMCVCALLSLYIRVHTCICM